MTFRKHLLLLSPQILEWVSCWNLTGDSARWRSTAAAVQAIQTASKQVLQLISVCYFIFIKGFFSLLSASGLKSLPLFASAS